MIQPYLKSEDVLKCPDDPNSPIMTLPGIRSKIERSYTVFTQLLNYMKSSNGASLAQISLPSQTALASERAWCNFGNRSERIHDLELLRRRRGHGPDWLRERVAPLQPCR